MSWLALIAIVCILIYMTTRSNKPTQNQHSRVPATDDIDEWQRGLQTIWSGPARTIEFAYQSFDDERTRRKVSVNRVAQADGGVIYLNAYCHLRKESRTFRLDRIDGDIIEAGRRYKPREWLRSRLLA